MARLMSELKQRKPFSSPHEEATLQILRTADQLNRQLAEFMKPFGISQTQYNALRILRGAGEEGLSCGEVGERMITREPDITRLLDRIERQGWLARRRHAEDRRVVRVSITDAGRDLLARMDKPIEQFMRTLFVKLSREELVSIPALMEQARLGRNE